MTRAQAAIIVPLIVRSLSSTQRAALLWLTDEWQDEEKGRTTMWGLSSKTIVRGLDANLAELNHQKRRTLVKGKWSRDEWRLTPLGRTIRDALLAEGSVRHEPDPSATCGMEATDA